MSDEEAATDALVKAAKEYLATRPAFRTRPMGAPGSWARFQQESEIAAEDALRAALAPFLPQEKQG